MEKNSSQFETADIRLPRKAGALRSRRSSTIRAAWGFVAHIKGKRSHQILIDAEEVLRNMDHRGACGCEPNTGDGAGILTALAARVFAARGEAGAEGDTAAAGAVCGGHRVFAARRGRAAKVQRSCRGNHRGAGPAACRLAAWCPRKPKRPISARPRKRRAAHRTARHRRRQETLRRRVRAATVFDSQASQPSASQRRVAGAGEDVLRLLAVDQGDHLQGHAHDRAAVQVLSRTSPRRITRATWRWSIRVSRRTRFRRGTVRSRCGS